MEFSLKWVYMAWYGVILRLDGALWLAIIFKPLLTQKRATKKQFESYFGMFVREKVSMIWNVRMHALLNDSRKNHQCGTDLFEGDYDARTALHLAATEGHAQCLQFLVDCIPEQRRAELTYSPTPGG